MASQPVTTAPAVPARDRDGRISLSYNYQWEESLAQQRAMAEWRAREARANSLETLGAALDDASIRFRRQADRAVLVPTAFARAESRYLAARDAYMTRLRQITGEDVADLQRRVAA